MTVNYPLIFQVLYEVNKSQSWASFWRQILLSAEQTKTESLKLISLSSWELFPIMLQPEERTIHQHEEGTMHMPTWSQPIGLMLSFCCEWSFFDIISCGPPTSSCSSGTEKLELCAMLAVLLKELCAMLAVLLKVFCGSHSYLWARYITFWNSF